MTGLTDKERADATAAEPDVHRCACGHAPKWHHDTRGCGYYGHAAEHRCPCALSSDESIDVLVAAARAEVLAKVEALAERSAANATMMRARGREGKTPLHKMDGREGNTWDVIAHDLRALVADLGGAS